MFCRSSVASALRAHLGALAITLWLCVLPWSTPHAQGTTGPRLLVGAGISGQRDGNRDLGSAGIAADVGLGWRFPSLEARLSATVFALPTGQGCACDPGSPPLAVQGTYGLIAAVQSVPRTQRLYWLAGAGMRRGGFRSWNEHGTSTVLAGAGWTFGAERRGAVETRYEYFFSPLGATRGLLPVYLTWRF